MHNQRKQQIESTLKAAGIRYGLWSRSADMVLRAPTETDDGGMDWVLSTELPAMVFDWERWEFVNEVLVADGMLVPAIGQVPLLDSHNRNSAMDVVGHVKNFTEATIGGYPGRIGRSYFAADPTSQIIAQKVRDGHITDGSVGYRVEKSIWIQEDQEAAVNGRVWKGPIKLSYVWSLKEFSVTPIGADVLAKVRLLCGKTA
jgi:hypothetical protein